MKFNKDRDGITPWLRANILEDDITKDLGEQELEHYSAV